MNLLNAKYNIAVKALSTLEDILQSEITIVIRDAAIQRFEYTVEAVWKCLQAYLNEYEGIICASPKMCFRESTRVGLLNKDETRLSLVMIDDRNLTSHTYHEEVANKIYESLNAYNSLMKKLLNSINEKL